MIYRDPKTGREYGVMEAPGTPPIYKPARRNPGGEWRPSNSFALNWHGEREEAEEELREWARRHGMEEVKDE